MASHHRIPSSHECWRIVCLKSLEATRPSLSPSCTSLCKSGNYSAHSLYKGLLLRNRWWLTIAPLTTSTSSSLTFHLHMSNRKLRYHFHISLVAHNSKHEQTSIPEPSCSFISRTPKVMFSNLVFTFSYIHHTIYLHFMQFVTHNHTITIMQHTSEYNMDNTMHAVV